MRGPFRVVAGLAGALACGSAGAVWCALTPPAFEAAATAGVDAGTGAVAPVDLSAIRSLVSAGSVLRQAALQPDAATAIERESRPGRLGRLMALLAVQSNSEDTLSRAADMLGPRIEVRPGPWPDTMNIVVRMSVAEDAAHVATAVADALVADLNGIAAHDERRTAQDARASLARAERRRSAALDHVEALRRIDFAPTASIRDPLPPKPSELALSDVAPLARAAAEAEARRLDAARTLGPKHPQLIQIETEARRAAVALATARAKSAALVRKRAPAIAEAEGGPDPRAAELAEAEVEAARAEADYDVEAARNRSHRGAARLLRAAPIPAAPLRQSSGATIAISAILGFLLVGAAPALKSLADPVRPGPDNARPLALLRAGALDRAGARRMIELLRIAETRGARHVLVLGEERRLVGVAARAIAQAVIEAGWRPLLIATADMRPTGRPRQAVTLAGDVFCLETASARRRPLMIARRGRGEHTRAVDANLAFDVAIFEDSACAADPHAILWVGDKVHDNAVQEQCRRRGLDPQRVVGRISAVRAA